MPKAVEKCMVCQANAEAFREFADVRGWRYVRCAACGFVFLDPQPTESELRTFYNHSYQYDMRRYRDSISRQGLWLDLLEKYCKGPGSLLEVGCSYGYFLATAKKKGWSVQGVELSGEAVNHARRELGMAVEQARIADIRRPSGALFDAIAAWHVLEHDPVPREFVRAAYDLLRPGGILALRVPNLGSTVARLSGSCWQWLSPPEHVCMYERKTLSHLLSLCDFEIVEWRTTRGNARNTWFEVLRAKTKKAIKHPRNARGSPAERFRFDPPPVYQDRLWYRAAERLVSVCTSPFDWFASRWMSGHGREAELAVIARRPVSRVDTQIAGASSCQGVAPQ